MAFTAPHLWFGDILPGFFTIRTDLNPPLEKRDQRAGYSRSQFHVLAGICAGDGGNRAGHT